MIWSVDRMYVIQSFWFKEIIMAIISIKIEFCLNSRYYYQLLYNKEIVIYPIVLKPLSDLHESDEVTVSSLSPVHYTRHLI